MTDKTTSKFQNHIFYIQLEGNYSFKEFLNQFIDFFNDPLTPKNVAIIIDGRLSSAKPSRQECKDAVSLFGKWVDKIICTAYVAPSDFQFGIGRQYSVEAEFLGLKSQIFRDFNPAEEWIEEKVKQFFE